MINQEDINNAKKISIVDYINETGMGDLEQSGHYHRFYYEGHDSIVIDNRKNRFYHNSTNENGDIIYFLQYFKDLSFQEAVSELNNSEKDFKAISSTRNSTYSEEPFELPQYLTIEKDALDNYLFEERKISKNTIDFFYRKGFIKQDKIGQIYFLWKENGHMDSKTVGGSRVNPVNNHRGILKNSENNFGFNIVLGDRIDSHYYFESAVDLMSFYDMNKDRIDNCRLCSLEGVKVMSVYTYIANTFDNYSMKPSTLYIATDNDKAGIRFYQEIKMNPLDYSDNQTLEVINLIPNYSYYDQNLLNIYTDVSEQYQVDWKELATVHKYETNCSLSTEITNKEGVGKYYGAESASKVTYKDINESTLHLAEDLSNYNKSFSSFVLETYDLSNYEITLEIYDNLKKNRYIPVNGFEILKDWNDVVTQINSKMIEIERFP